MKSNPEVKKRMSNIPRDVDTESDKKEKGRYTDAYRPTEKKDVAFK